MEILYIYDLNGKAVLRNDMCDINTIEIKDGAITINLLEGGVHVFPARKYSMQII